jgi:hypothetical protein
MAVQGLAATALPEVEPPSIVEEAEVEEVEDGEEEVCPKARADPMVSDARRATHTYWAVRIVVVPYGFTV